METIGKQRGCLGARGLVDLDKIAKILLSEFRAGTLGTISLELPHLVEHELAEQAIIDEKKADKKGRSLKKTQKQQTIFNQISDSEVSNQ